MRFLLISSSLVLALGAASLLPGCSAREPDAAEASVQSGSLELPLVSSVGGHTYRLYSGYLYVYGPSFQYADLSGDAASISLSLQTGHYSAELYNPVLARDDGSGTFIPVQATLVSNYEVDFDIYNGTTSSIAFEFETDGALVRVGSGVLEVRVDVSEDGAACVPFANDCGDGSWCPPTELTGRPRACVSVGARAVGEHCAGPLDCAADSSCFDFGSGPVCAALCPAEGFGHDCANGVSCVAAGSEYGVCTPAAESPPEGNN